MNTQKELTQMNLNELKVVYFDTARTVQKAQSNLAVIEQQIERLESVPKPPQ